MITSHTGFAQKPLSWVILRQTLPHGFEKEYVQPMNKRSFLKVCSSVITGHFLVPRAAWAQAERIKNWAGNLEYSTENLYSAQTLAQVQEFVKKQSILKVLGTRHCFNKIADSKRQFISLKDY